MPKSIGDHQLQGLIERTVESFPLDACSNCECFLGYIAHLKIGSDESGREYLQQFTTPRSDMHACLGCEPCPPGDHYAAYLRDTRAKQQI
jgi:hypothetical protein